MAHLIDTAAGRHNELRREIAALDHAEPDFVATGPRLQELLAKQKCLLAELEWAKEKMEKEKAEHLRMKHSVTNKWSSKLTGRGAQFQEAAVREEREYLEALGEERQAQTAYDRVNFDIEEVMVQRKNAKQSLNLRTRLQQELDTLYDSVFLHCDFATEKEWRAMLSNALEADHRAQSAVNFERQTHDLLDQAQMSLCGARSNIDEALDENKWDIAGWSSSDIWETQMLVDARQSMQNFQYYFHQAQHMNGAVRGINFPSLPQWSATEVILDNPISDIGMHGRYKAAVASFVQAQIEMEALCEESRQRVAGAKLKAVQTTEHITEIRHQLHECRAAIFVNVVGQPSPVPYDASVLAGATKASPLIHPARDILALRTTPSPPVIPPPIMRPAESGTTPAISQSHPGQTRPGLPSRPSPRPPRSSAIPTSTPPQGPNVPLTVPMVSHAPPLGPPPGHLPGESTQTPLVHAPPPGPPPGISKPPWASHDAPPAGPPHFLPPQGHHAPPLGPPPGFGGPQNIPYSQVHHGAIYPYPPHYQIPPPPPPPSKPSFRQEMALNMAWALS